MNKLGLVVKRKKRFVLTTDSKHALPVAENVLNRDFAAMDQEYARAGFRSHITRPMTVRGPRDESLGAS